MPSRIIRTEADLEGWERFQRSHPLPFTVTLTKGARRSNPQNATAAVWYGQIGTEYGQSPDEVKAECKLQYGLPIMQRDNEAWVAQWEPLYGPLPYRARLLAFQCIPLTSKFTVKQMSEYMDTVQRVYRGQGVDLIDPEMRRIEQMYGADR